MVAPDSRRISRVLRYSGYCSVNFTTHTGLSPSVAYLSRYLCSCHRILNAVLQPQGVNPLVWPLPFSLAATGGISSISFPLATKMFQFTRLASSFKGGYYRFTIVGCPIRTSGDRRFGASSPGFSQLSTSFIASESLTIHPTPLGA